MWKKLEQWQRIAIITVIAITVIAVVAQFTKKYWKKKKIADLLIQYKGKLTQEQVKTDSANIANDTDTTETETTPTDMSTTGLTPTANDGINNPLNLRVEAVNNWQGKITQAGAKFEQFATMWQGWRAGMKNLLNMSKQTTTHSFNDTIPILSPNSDGNNDANYIKGVAGNSGVDTSLDLTTLSADDFKAVVKAMAKEEQKADFVINDDDVNMAYDSLTV
jgi:hypothetical protein